MLVHVLDSLQNLLSVALHFKLAESLSPLDLLVQGRITAQLHNDVDILLILEEILELHNVWMVHGAMDPDLTLQFLFCSRLRQRALRHNLDGLRVVELHIADLVNFSKSSLAEKGPLHVAFGEHLPISCNRFLFNDL